MQDTATLLSGLIGLVFCVVLFKRRRDPLRSIPAIGPSAPIISFVGAYKFMNQAREMLTEGYEKYPHGIFKIAMPDRWLVIVNGSKLIDEIRKLPDDQMSLIEAADDTVHTRYTLGADVVDDPYHVTAIRNQLTRNLAALLPAISDEIHVSCQDLIPVQGDEWLDIDAWPTMSRIIARASNRVFVGVPKCRDDEYLDLAIGFTRAVNKSRNIINLFPAIFHPIVGDFFAYTREPVHRAAAHFKPIIEDRFSKLETLKDDWSEKPNDMLMWLLDEAKVRGSSVQSIVRKIMTVNFAAIHTSSSFITHALYHLAEKPEYMQILREEVDALSEDGKGWTKETIASMTKLDSFLRESHRVKGNAVSLTRKAMQDVVLSNGTRIPAGSLVVANAIATHNNGDKYANADVFEPFRFSAMRKDGQGMRLQYVNTSVDYIPFGIGVHACPGRFFASSELKLILAYIVRNFDVKHEQEGKRPLNIWFGPQVSPAPDAKVLFRRRQAVRE